MAKTRRRHSKEFELETVRLVNDSGKSIRQISEELGIPCNRLNRWQAELRADAAEAFRKPFAATGDARPKPSASGSSNAPSSG